MRMDDMNKLFEEHGFTVERMWDGGIGGYRFIISKYNVNWAGIYVYPAELGPSEASKHQREFVDYAIERFYECCTNNRHRTGADMYFNTDAIRMNAKPIKAKMNPWLKAEVGIEHVIFNDPATIVFWSDGSKTVVKCRDDDVYDPEKGLAMAISKKALGNKGNYYNELKKWLPEEKPDIQFELKCSDWKTDALSEALEYKGKRDAVQKAYDILAQFQNDSEVSNKRLNEVLRYLHDALED